MALQLPSFNVVHPFKTDRFYNRLFSVEEHSTGQWVNILYGSLSIVWSSECMYPGYKAYFDRFDTKSFQTEYTTRHCNSEKPLLYSQVPKHPWSETRRPAAASRYISYEAAARPTHLRPPFAARMLSYVPDAEGKILNKTHLVERMKIHVGWCIILIKENLSEKRI